MSEPRQQILTIGRMRLNIVEWGDPAAPPLILQHGGRDHARSWDWVAAALADRFRIIAPDLRGHGDSAWTNDGGYDMLGLIEDFAGIVRALDLPPCAMVGHSLGGQVVTRFAGLYPDRVTRLVNIEGLGGMPEPGGRDVLDEMRAWLDKRTDLTSRRARDYPDLATLTTRLMKTDNRLTPEMAEHLARHAARPNADGTLRIKHDPALKQTPPFDISEETRHRLWAAISCPLLLVYGADSWASNPAADGRAAHFRDVRVELFERAGHWVHHDRQDDFIALLRDFLG